MYISMLKAKAAICPKNRIAIIIWDIGQIGGIATHAQETKKVLDEFGISNDVIILNDKSRPYKLEKFRIEAKDKTFKVRGIELSVKRENLLNTLSFLSKRYDVLFHTTACIHNDKSGWLGVYLLKKRHVVVISDVYYDKFYPYYKQALRYIDKIYATNQAVKNYLDSKEIKSELLIHPFSFDKDFQKIKTEQTIIWANQWRGWKGIGFFIEQLSKIKAKGLLFGCGREYYNLWDRIPKNAEYLGFRKPVEVKQAYTTGMMAVDLTGQSKKYWGHYNRTTIEPMFYKCVVVANEKIIEPYSPIPKNVVLAVNKNNFVERVNNLIQDRERQKEIRENAFDWAIEYYNHTKVVEQIIGYIG